MENSPHYSGDSFIPIPNAEKNPYSKKSKKHVIYDSKTFKKNRDISDTQSTNSLCSHPWKKIPSYSFGVIGLHEEINDFYDTMHPSAEETEIRLKVIEHITRIVHSLWPQAMVEVFGSFRTGLYLPSSDIDIVIIGEWKCLPLSTLSEGLQRSGIKSEDITIIPHASVPIIRVLHTPSRIRADISFNVQNGVKNTKFVKKLLKEYSSLSKLILVLKQFLIHRGLNEVYTGGMSSYCLTLLIVSFLQGFHKPKCPPSTNLGTLLLEFFEHYGVNFNYGKVSIHFDNGGNYQPKPKEAGPYLFIEDPLVAGKDIAKGTYLMHLLKLAFQNAFHVLHKAVIDSTNKQKSVKSYLQLILQIEDDVLRNRQWIHDNSSGILRSISRLMQEPMDSDSQTTITPKQDKKKRKSSNNASFDCISETPQIRTPEIQNPGKSEQGFLGQILNTRAKCVDILMSSWIEKR